MRCLTTGLCPAFTVAEIPKALEISSRGKWSPGESWIKCSRTFSPPLQSKIYLGVVIKSTLSVINNDYYEFYFGDSG